MSDVTAFNELGRFRSFKGGTCMEVKKGHANL